MTDQRLQEIIQDVAQRYCDAGYFPSASVRAFDREETLAACCVGDCRVDSLFDVASLTKIAVATRILLYVAQGKLELDQTVSDLYEEIAQDEYLSARLSGVTLRRLLTHTSSITPWFPFYCRRGDDFWTVFRHALKTTDVVKGMEYSDLNFMLLGILWERLSGLALPEALQKELVEPYGLGRMMYHPPMDSDIIPSSFDNLIEMDMCRERSMEVDGWRPLHTPVRGTVNDGNAHYFFDDAAGHAGIFADTQAYMRLCQLYMNTGHQVLKDAQQEQPGAPTRGLGLQTGVPYPHGCGHTGFTGTSIYFSSEYNIGVVAFTNRLFYDHANKNLTGDFRRALHEAVLAYRRASGTR